MNENPENSRNIQEIRDEKGRFKEGKSGNLLGKPKGAKNKFSFTNYWQARWDKDPQEFEELATLFMKDEKLRGLIIQLIDGKPKESIDMKHDLSDNIIELIKNANQPGNPELPKENTE